MNNTTETIFQWSPWLAGNVAALDDELRGIKVTTTMKYLKHVVSTEDRIIVVKGPRGVGKTTALKWVARRLIEEGHKVLFLGVDWGLYDHRFLTGAIDYFITEICKMMPRTAEVFVILDEIQTLANWEKVVKQYHDLNKKIRFVVAGSNTNLLTRVAFSYLSHRAVEFRFYPLKFSTVLLHVAERNEITSDIVVKARKGLDLVSDGNNEELRSIFETVSVYRPVIERHLEAYLSSGGYPAMVFGRYDTSFFDSIISEVLLKDMRIREHKKVMALLRRMTDEVHDKTINGLANDLGEKGGSGISNWIDGLEKSGIIDVIYKYDPSGKSLKGRFKAYFVDRGMKNAVMNNFGPASAIDLENDAEALVYDVLKRWSYRRGYKIWYWKDRKNREIDFVTEGPDSTLIVESKFSNDPEIPDADIPDVKNAKKIVVTKRSFGTHDGWLFIPLYVFSLFA